MIYYIKKDDSINEILSNVHEKDTIFIEDGIYNEKIKITTPNITIIGNGKNTIIQNKDYYNKIHKDNKEYLTVRTYTLMVCADNVTIKNLTIKNLSTPSSIYGQAVALHVIGDNFNADNLNLIGAQDTLFLGPLPVDLTIRYKDLLPEDELTTKKCHQYFSNCYIEGDVDFIFGCGIALFENCTLNSIDKGYICAPSHPKDYKYGFVFLNCILTSSNNIVDSVYLARPWRDYGASTFLSCKIKGNHIKECGFNNWTLEREKTCRFKIDDMLDPKKLVSFAKTITKDDASLYTKSNIFNS